jgi:phosphoribosylformylglycinamidine cyclo-ligase
LGEELLTPTRVYAKDLLAIISATEVHSISHITGGGLANNLVRVLPDGVVADLDRSAWTPPPIFGLVQDLGGVSQPDLEATLNQGVGMALVLPEASVDTAQRLAEQAGIASWVLGRVRSEPGSPARVELHGDHLR